MERMFPDMILSLFRPFVLLPFLIGTGSFQRLPAATPAQSPPTEKCYFDGYEGRLAEVVKKSAGEQPGDAVIAYRVQGLWTCAYLTSKTGNSPGWILSSAIRIVTPDNNPPLNAWLGMWKNGAGHITIGKSKSPMKLMLGGGSAWHGNNGVVHTGSFEGEASPVGNRVHLVTGRDERHGCVVDLELYGKFMLAQDNGVCGGANVSFSGIWARSK